MRWLITGVSSGLGAELAKAALARGDEVAGTVRRSDAKAALEALAPGRAFGLIADMAEEAQVRAAVADAQAAMGGIDVLVNNAGYGLVGAIEEASLQEVQAQFAANVLGPIAAIQAALPAMRARRDGRIINITSVSGLQVWQGTGVYCASKFALEAIGQTLRQELGPLGIKVTNVAPGGLRTDYAGRSLTRTARRIDDYGPTAHLSHELLKAGAGQEKGDPARAAQAILKLADAPSPPLHLLLGSDAVHYWTQAKGAFDIEFGEWAQLSLSIGFAEA